MGSELKSAQSALSPTNIHSLILYNSAGSPCARRVRITLLEKGLDFDTVEINLSNMEQRSPEYLALNPNGFVPTLAHGKHVVFESSVINQYLEDQFPEKPLMPNNLLEQAQVAMWIEYEAQMAKIFRPIMYQRLLGPIMHISRTLQEDDIIVARSTTSQLDKEWHKKVWSLKVLTPESEAKHEQDLLAWLDRVEAQLEGQQYLVGNQFTQADISLYPRIEMYRFINIDINPSRYPNTLDWMNLLAKRPSFENSMTAEANKIRKLALSPIVPKIRKALSKQKPSILDSLFLWGMGKILRKVQNVDKQLTGTYEPRSLPKPMAPKQDINFKSLAEYQQSPTEVDRPITLYGNKKSVHSQRIEILIQQLGLDYTFINIDLKEIDKSYLSINPLGQVPAIKHGNDVIFDSGVIAEYLINTFDTQDHWLPKKSLEASTSRMWLALEKGMHKEFKPLVDQYIFNKENPQQHTVSEKDSLDRINSNLSQLNQALLNSPYLCGDALRYADIAWFSRIHSLNKINGFSLKTFPAIKKWLSKLSIYLEQNKDDGYANK